MLKLVGEGKALGNIHWVGTDYVKCGIERSIQIQIQISLFSTANGLMKEIGVVLNIKTFVK